MGPGRVRRRRLFRLVDNGEIHWRSYEKTILEVILEEFKMYHAHLRLINKKPNYGWLRNMYYSLRQQVMRLRSIRACQRSGDGKFRREVLLLS